MVAVRINGEEAPVKSDGLPRLSDVVELIKSVIDPDHMITQLAIDGRDFSEEDWSASPSHYNTSIIEVQTGTPSDYVRDRMTKSPVIVRACRESFHAARLGFEEGKNQDANAELKDAVQALLAFCEWYGAILDLVPEERRLDFDINDEMEDMVEVCKKLCQQQLYQSWWALGESIKNELEPALDKLESKMQGLAEKI